MGIQMKQKELTKPFMLISNWKNPLASIVQTKKFQRCVDPFKPEFTIVISIHYNPRIAVAILDL